MTDAFSGFLYPEEAAAKLLQQTPQENVPTEGVSGAVLRLLQTSGPKPVTELVSLLGAGPRAVYSTIDRLESAHLVEVTGTEPDEVVELTELGLRSIA
jgi:hypothetical protein